jgi:hypothetical protein
MPSVEEVGVQELMRPAVPCVKGADNPLPFSSGAATGTRDVWIYGPDIMNPDRSRRDWEACLSIELPLDLCLCLLL